MREAGPDPKSAFTRPLGEIGLLAVPQSPLLSLMFTRLVSSPFEARTHGTDESYRQEPLGHRQDAG